MSSFEGWHFVIWNLQEIKPGKYLRLPGADPGGGGVLGVRTPPPLLVDPQTS